MRRMGFLLGVLGVLGATIAIAAPRATAFACPGCYGFQKLAPGVFAQPGTAELLPALQNARARVAAFYGSPVRQPRLLICTTPACHARMGGGGARAMTYGTVAIYVSPRGLETSFLAHELAHIESHARIGLIGMATGRIPAWFDEGLAVIISQDPRYTDQASQVADCDGIDPATLPRSARNWRQKAGQPGNDAQYHDAACAVQDWLAKHDKNTLAYVFANGF